MKKITSSPLIFPLLLISGPLLIFYIHSLLLIIEKKDATLSFFSLFLHILVFSYSYFRISRNIKTALLFVLGICMPCNLNISYGRNTLDHYSLRRIEFKTASLWFRENAGPDDRLLINDPNAIEKKAVLMKKLRDRAPGMNSMKLVKTSTAKNGLTSYIYRFEP